MCAPNNPLVRTGTGPLLERLEKWQRQNVLTISQAEPPPTLLPALIEEVLAQRKLEAFAATLVESDFGFWSFKQSSNKETDTNRFWSTYMVFSLSWTQKRFKSWGAPYFRIHFRHMCWESAVPCLSAQDMTLVWGMFKTNPPGPCERSHFRLKALRSQSGNQKSAWLPLGCWFPTAQKFKSCHSLGLALAAVPRSGDAYRRPEASPVPWHGEVPGPFGCEFTGDP